MAVHPCSADWPFTESLIEFPQRAAATGQLPAHKANLRWYDLENPDELESVELIHVDLCYFHCGIAEICWFSFVLYISPLIFLSHHSTPFLAIAICMGKLFTFCDNAIKCINNKFCNYVSAFIIYIMIVFFIEPFLIKPV